MAESDDTQVAINTGGAATAGAGAAAPAKGHGLTRDDAEKLQVGILSSILAFDFTKDISGGLRDYADKALYSGATQKTSAQIDGEIKKIDALVRKMGDGDAAKRGYFNATFSFLGEYSVDQDVKDGLLRVAALLNPDDEKRKAAEAGEADDRFKNFAAKFVAPAVAKQEAPAAADARASARNAGAVEPAPTNTTPQMATQKAEQAGTFARKKALDERELSAQKTLREAEAFLKQKEEIAQKVRAELAAAKEEAEKKAKKEGKKEEKKDVFATKESAVKSAEGAVAAAKEGITQARGVLDTVKKEQAEFNGEEQKKKDAAKQRIKDAEESLVRARDRLKRAPSNSQAIQDVKDAEKTLADIKQETSVAVPSNDSTGESFLDKFDIGKILSSLVVGGGGFVAIQAMLSSIVGDGILNTILSAMIAIPLGMFAGSQFGDSINGFFGLAKSTDKKGQDGQQRALAAGMAPTILTQKDFAETLATAQARGDRTDVVQVYKTEHGVALSTVPKNVTPQGMIAMAKVQSTLAACSVTGACNMAFAPDGFGNYAMSATNKLPTRSVS